MFFSPTSSNFSSLTCSRAGGHPLCLRCFTMEMWRPKLRWTEQHSSQIRTPRLMLVQPGSGRDRQIRDSKCHKGATLLGPYTYIWTLKKTSVKVRLHTYALFSGTNLLSQTRQSLWQQVVKQRLEYFHTKLQIMGQRMGKADIRVFKHKISNNNTSPPLTGLDHFQGWSIKYFHWGALPW